MKATVSLEEMKRQAMKKWPALSEEVFLKGLEKCFKQYYEQHQEGFFMLFNKERLDITIFENPRSMVNVCDCLMNRGEPIDVGLNEDENSIDIYIRIDGEVYTYYFFGYDSGVITE